MVSPDPRGYATERRSPLSVNTSNSGAMPQARAGARNETRRFSYLETPIDMQEPQFGNDRFAPNHGAIEEQNTPIEGIEGYHIQSREAFPVTAYTMPPASNMHAAPVRPERTSSPYGVPEPRGIHPAYYAPVASQPYSSPRSRPGSEAQLPTAYPTSQSPEPQTMNRMQRSSTIPIKPESEEGYKPKSPGFHEDRVQIPYSPQHGVFNPTSLVGPNGMDPEMHQPGQVAHPNMQSGESSSSKGEWAHSLCECNSDVGTCMTGIFCPCILDSKTAYRMERKGEKRDPTDLLGFGNCNKRCGIMGIFGICGLCCKFPPFRLVKTPPNFPGIFPLTLRTRIRHAYKLQGNFCSDILHSCCCCCCVAIQNEREVRSREDRIRQHAGPSTQYRSDTGQGMVYVPGGGM